VADAASALPAGKRFRVKFNPDEGVPFFAASSGVPGVVASQNGLECLHGQFASHVLGDARLSHKVYFERVTGNPKHLKRMFPASCT